MFHFENNWGILGFEVYLYLWGYHDCVKGTKPSSHSVDSPTPQLHRWFRCRSWSPFITKSADIRLWGLLVYPHGQDGRFSVRVESGPGEQVGPFTNIGRHMAHKHITTHVCAHTYTSAPAIYQHDTNTRVMRADPDVKENHIQAEELCGCVFMCALFPGAHISLRDMMSMWREQGSTELSHGLQGASVMIKRTFGRATEALPKQPSTRSQSHLLYHSLTWPHKFPGPVPVDPYCWRTSKSKSYHRLLVWWDWWKMCVISEWETKPV